MESYGALLKAKRIEKNIDFETISRETTITRQYLEALEAEDTAAFPGEPYLVGFLKNYAEYLELDSNKILNLYRARIIQESPVPENLIVHQRPRYLLPLIIIGSVLVAALLGAGIFFAMKLKKDTVDPEAELKKESDKKSYELSEKPFSGRLFKGDQLIFNAKGGKIILTTANTNGNLSLETPIGVQIVELSEEVELDVDGDSVSEMIVYVSDVSTNDLDRGAEVRILLKNGAASLSSTTLANEIPSVRDLPAEQERTVILEDTRAYPFTINASFLSGTVFRYRSDRKENVEDYLAKGDTVNVTSSNGIRLWISNGSAVKLQVIANSKTYDLGLGKPGEVMAEDIRWIRDTDGKYKLVVAQLD